MHAAEGVAKNLGCHSQCPGHQYDRASVVLRFGIMSAGENDRHTLHVLGQVRSTDAGNKSGQQHSNREKKQDVFDHGKGLVNGGAIILR